MCLQFQLTINLVALVVAFVAAVTTGQMPLNVLQLLWVNLIMDALAALGMLTRSAGRFFSLLVPPVPTQQALAGPCPHPTPLVWLEPKGSLG